MSIYLIGGRLVAGGGIAAGQITLRRMVPLSSVTELVLNDAETVDANLRLPLRDPDTGVVIDLPQQLVPGRDFVGVMQGDTLLAAGPVWSDPFSFPYTSRLVARGLWSYFDRRYVLPVLTTGQLPRDVTSRWEDLSLRTIAKRLVQQACSHPSAGLPIDYEDDVAGTSVREYTGADGVTVGDALRRLTEVVDGPDIAFRPYITADRQHVRWALVTGDPDLTQAGADWYWDVSAPTPHAVMPSLERDGRQLHSRRFLTGASVKNEIQNGSFEDGLTGFALGSNSVNLDIRTDSPKHGGKHARWEAVASGNAHLDTTRTVNAEPGESFTFTAAGRAGTSGTMRLMLRFRDADGDTLSDVPSTAVAVTTTVGQWTDLELVGVAAPAGTVSVQAYVTGIATSAGHAFTADTLMLTRGSEVVPFAVDSIELQAVAESTDLTTAGFPLLEDWENRSTVLREETLQAHADEGVLRGSTHIETRTLKAKRFAHPALGTYQPGDYAKVRQGVNARGPEQTVRERIVRVSFRSEGDVDVELAPQRVVSGYPVPSSNRRWLSDQLAALERRVAENKG